MSDLLRFAIIQNADENIPIIKFKEILDLRIKLYSSKNEIIEIKKRN